ncbi:hypothetical protein AAHE18_14G011500 [Arachis hypogaea]
MVWVLLRATLLVLFGQPPHRFCPAPPLPLQLRHHTVSVLLCLLEPLAWT